MLRDAVSGRVIADVVGVVGGNRCSHGRRFFLGDFFLGDFFLGDFFLGDFFLGDFFLGASSFFGFTQRDSLTGDIFGRDILAGDIFSRNILAGGVDGSVGVGKLLRGLVGRLVFFLVDFFVFFLINHGRPPCSVSDRSQRLRHGS